MDICVSSERVQRLCNAMLAAGEKDFPMISIDVDGHYGGLFSFLGEEATRRIIACVKACDELETEKLEAQNAEGKPLWQFVQEVIQQRDRLQRELNEIRENYDARGLALQAAKAMQVGETERADLAEWQRAALLAACRKAVLALARAAEQHPIYRRDYDLLSAAIDAAVEGAS